jgi:hypothetical protein
MNKFSCLFMMALAASAVAAHADTTGGELDGNSAVPAALIVQEDSQGNVQTFQSSDQNFVADDASAVAAVATTVTAANQIANVAVVSELDRTSSDDSWYRWYHPGFARGWGGYYGNYCNTGWNYGWNYGYNYYGYAYTYAPYYGYYNGGYRYHFYRRR